MRSFEAVLALLVLFMGIALAAPIKRDVQYVVATTTVEMPYAQFTAIQPTLVLVLPPAAPTSPPALAPAAAPTTQAAAPAAAPATTAAVAASSSRGSFWQRLQLLFGLGGGDGDTAASTAPPAQATTAAATPTAGAPAGGGLATVVDTQVVYITATASSPSGSASTGFGGISLLATVLAFGSASSSFSTSRTQVQIVSQAAPGSSNSGGSGFLDNLLGNNGGNSSSGGDITIGPEQDVAQQAKGISYSPYTKSGSCKSLSDVTHDFEILQHYSEIRLYSTDCSAIENLLLLMSSGQSLFLGIYNIDSGTITSGLQTIKTAVEGSSRGWDAVNTISIGNERVNNGWSTVSDLQTAVDTAKSWIKSNAPEYTGPVVTVDTLVATVSNPGLCDVSDYIAVNCHPFWDGGVQPSNAGPWLQQQILNLQKVCGSSKKILITETGWPTQGDTFGSCVPSLENQNAAIESINLVLADQVYMFTTYNDYWKDPGPSNVERYWGIYGDPQS